LAPALPGFALLLGWWARETRRAHDRWDVRAVRATVVLLSIAVAAFAAALAIVGIDSWQRMRAPVDYMVISAMGLIGAAILAVHANTAAGRGEWQRCQWALLLAYCVLLTLPASQLYREIDAWQNLPAVGRAIGTDAGGRPLILMAPDETTRALIDMYARNDVQLVAGPIDTDSIARLQEMVSSEPRALVAAQLPGREDGGIFRRVSLQLGLNSARTRDEGPATRDELPGWISASRLRLAHRYSLPNGRRYVLLEPIR